MNSKSRATSFLEDSAAGFPEPPVGMLPDEMGDDDEFDATIGTAIDAAFSTLFVCVEDLEHRVQVLERNYENTRQTIEGN